MNFVNKEIPENNRHEKKEKTAEIIMSKRAKREQDKVAEGGEILKEQLFTDSTDVFLLDDNDVMELKAAKIVDWQYEGLPDGYQLIMIPYSVERTNLSNQSGIYLQVGDSYIKNVMSYTLCNFATEEYPRMNMWTGWRQIPMGM